MKGGYNFFKHMGNCQTAYNYQFIVSLLVMKTVPCLWLC
jgi:hypothetical protein